MSNNIRNITIIAHVDHGKTTMIDNLMKQSGSFRENEVVDERLMDSGELEKERGITILAKPASINWKDSRVNIIDTPGHRDFAAEVERVLSMADGALLLIDSAEGVMPQTKFVLAKALKQGFKPTKEKEGRKLLNPISACSSLNSSDIKKKKHYNLRLSEQKKSYLSPNFFYSKSNLSFAFLFFIRTWFRYRYK